MTLGLSQASYVLNGRSKLHFDCHSFAEFHDHPNELRVSKHTLIINNKPLIQAGKTCGLPFYA